MDSTFRYEIREEILSLEETEYAGYGILMTAPDGSTDYAGDISCCREDVELLADVLNKMDAQGVHFRDIIEDFLP